MTPKNKALDAIVIGAGPSGLAASIALSGWRPFFVPGQLEDSGLGDRLRRHLPLARLQRRPRVARRDREELGRVDLVAHRDGALPHLLLPRSARRRQRREQRVMPGRDGHGVRASGEASKIGLGAVSLD